MKGLMMRLRIECVLVAGLALGVILLAADPSGAEDRTISVTGQGSSSAVPDQAQLSVGVVTSAASAREAALINRERMAKTLRVLSEMGIKEEDLATSDYSIRYEHPRPQSEGDQGLYRVSNMLRVKLDNWQEVDSVLDAVVEAGSNRIWEVEMTISETGDLEAEARGKAVADARAKAEDLARLHGAELGSVLKIAEVGYSNEPIARMLNHSANSGGVIRSGEMQVSVKLKVVYELR